MLTSFLHSKVIFEYLARSIFQRIHSGTCIPFVMKHTRIPFILSPVIKSDNLGGAF